MPPSTPPAIFDGVSESHADISLHIWRCSAAAEIMIAAGFIQARALPFSLVQERFQHADEERAPAREAAGACPRHGDVDKAAEFDIFATATLISPTKSA